VTHIAQMPQLDAAPAPAADAVNETDVARKWLADFQAALVAKDAAAVCELFVADCWWRDLYALTWDITALRHAPEFKAMLEKDAFPKAFGEIELDGSFPVTVQADGILEVLYTFTTDVGIGRGVVRLQEDDTTFKAWTISTSLQELKAFPENRVTIADARKEEHNQPARPGERKTWEQQTEERLAFRDHEPSVLILGGGHSGLFLAARLKQINVPTLQQSGSA
jgi:putative flavoprotein involved in K+ transport